MARVRTKTTDIVDAVTTTMGGEQPHVCAHGSPNIRHINHVESTRSRTEAMPPVALYVMVQPEFLSRKMKYSASNHVWVSCWEREQRCVLVI